MADVIKEKEPQAKLLSLKVGGLSVTAIPVPVPDADWDNEDYVVGGADTGRVIVKDEGDTEDVALVAEVSPGARVWWGKGTAGNRPDFFNYIKVRASFDMGEYLYLKVTADDGITSNYYRFGSSLASPVTELVNLTIAGRDALDLKAAVGDISTPINPSDIGSVAITMKEAANAVVKGEPQDETSVIRYALAANASSLPTEPFTTNNNFVFPVGNTAPVLYVEVTAQNEENKAYYAFFVYAGRMATISSLRLDAAEVAGKGTEHALWNSVPPGSFNSADQKTGGFNINIELDDKDGRYEYAKATGLGAGVPSSFTNSGKLEFANNEVLVVKVYSARDNNVDVRYYKVRINLLAANFKKQPASAVYYYYNANTKIGPGEGGESAFDWYDYVGLTGVNANDPKFTNIVTPLSFELDRAGNYTYQWYEANSWYGGYGFDADGRVSWLDIGGVQHWESSFNEDPYHIRNFDEKNNVSLHNGGNQFYRLPTTGRAIQGANSATYTPPIDKRPFIANFTHESHYYWVVVTDSSGLKVTSSRATIVSERDPTKKHHIVDLNAYLTPGSIGLQETPRNIQAFTFKREKRTIPVTFPTDFNIMDYSVAIVQATFFLKDGTPWIQNWTQGDIGFEKDGENLVLYYNLTNNNATLGLDGDGKEPQGGSLIDIPTHLVVKPAGEKPPKEMPPLNSDGTPKESGDAQGWFTPFIELVEVRFLGPARNQ
jgi:hypothetical protein